MSDYLVTTSGKVLPSGSPLAERECRLVLVESERNDYLARNLGYVAVRIRQGRAFIKLRPAIVAPRAVTGALLLLEKHRLSQAMISHFESRWHDEIVSGRLGGVRRRLVELLDDARRRRASMLLVRAEELNSLEEASPLTEVMRMWTRNPQEFDARTISALLTRAGQLRCVIVEGRSDLETLYFKDIMGQGFVGFDEHWRNMASGLRIQDQPDYEFGCWIEGTYRDVARSMRPRLDAVDTEVKRPHRGLVRSRYRRLVLPFASPARTVTILSATVVDRGIDLRLEASEGGL